MRTKKHTRARMRTCTHKHTRMKHTHAHTHTHTHTHTKHTHKHTQAGMLGARVLKDCVLEKIEGILDEEKSVKHSKLSEMAEEAILDPGKVCVCVCVSVCGGGDTGMSGLVFGVHECTWYSILYTRGITGMSGLVCTYVHGINSTYMWNNREACLLSSWKLGLTSATLFMAFVDLASNFQPSKEHVAF